MTLGTDVWPALLGAYVPLIGAAPPPALVGTYGGQVMASAPLRGLSEGEQFSVPDSPWAWLLNGNGRMENKQGADLALTVWNFTLKLLCTFENDPTTAERILQPIIEQVRRVHEFHMKLGTQTIAFSILRGTDWGYTPINEIWYRTCDCDIEVWEKEHRTMQV